MIASPLTLEHAFDIGHVSVSKPVVIAWALMAFLTLVGALTTRRLAMRPGGAQTVLETFVETLDDQIRATMRCDPAPYRALLGSIFLFVLAANWCSILPGVESPTARLETDAALALIVLAATVWHGLRTRGVWGYLKTFAEPSFIMIPLNLVEQITRTFSLIVRLFGNVMSGAFVVGIVLSLAGLLAPIPFMALDLLTGAVQAYIFAVLAMVFIGAAVAEERRSDSAGNG